MKIYENNQSKMTSIWDMTKRVREEDPNPYEDKEA